MRSIFEPDRVSSSSPVPRRQPTISLGTAVLADSGASRCARCHWPKAASRPKPFSWDRSSTAARSLGSAGRASPTTPISSCAVAGRRSWATQPAHRPTTSPPTLTTSPEQTSPPPGPLSTPSGCGRSSARSPGTSHPKSLRRSWRPKLNSIVSSSRHKACGSTSMR